MLFWDGEPCAGIFPIIQGSLKIFQASPGGREVMLAIESAPTTVAELPLFDGGPYPASIRVWSRNCHSGWRACCRTRRTEPERRPSISR